MPVTTTVQPIPHVTPKITQLFIDNQWVNAANGKTIPTIDPATLEKIADVQLGDEVDVDKAVAAAKSAFALGSPWRRMDASQRGRLIAKVADLIEQDNAYLASLECRDVGKPYLAALHDISFVVQILRYQSGWTDKLCGKTLPVDGDFFTYTRLEAIGVCGIILPWNFPLVLLAVKVGSALAAGCTVVIKPAEQTPLTALHFASICASAGIPSGVVNVVTGLGATAGAALANHMDVDKISFTGSTDVGRLIMKASADSNLKKVTLELGGKSPCIVFSDANVDHAVKMAHFALFFNSGQACSAASRCFVQEDIYDEFVAKAAQRANEKIVGDPFNPKTENGPQIDAIQHKKILELIESGKGEGARLVAGGGSKEGKGFFIEPTVFADVTDHMRIAREEIFGPVQQIMKFRSVEEVIQRANDSNFALAASVFTKDINKALTIANSIKSGIVWINCHHVFRTQAPFGGCKESGMGREYAEEGIREYCEIKTVTVKIPQKNS